LNCRHKYRIYLSNFMFGSYFYFLGYLSNWLYNSWPCFYYSCLQNGKVNGSTARGGNAALEWGEQRRMGMYDSMSIVGAQHAVCLNWEEQQQFSPLSLSASQGGGRQGRIHNIPGNGWNSSAVIRNLQDYTKLNRKHDATYGSATLTRLIRSTVQH
jgi:hypothetical protein